MCVSNRKILFTTAAYYYVENEKKKKRKNVLFRVRAHFLPSGIAFSSALNIVLNTL